MVVCKCRKATKFYCFVHKVPVCGECICFPEHQICVVRPYSDWVIDGEYEWPTKCCHCHSMIMEGASVQTTRLGCLHVIHTSCLVSHIKGFPSHTAPAGYVCPACSTSIWPPKSVKDPGSLLHSKLKEAIMQTGLEKNFFGTLPVSLPAVEARSPPFVFASDPLMPVSVRVNGGSLSSSAGKDAEQSSVGYRLGSNRQGEDKPEVDSPSSASPSLPTTKTSFKKNTTPSGHPVRKSAIQVGRQNSEVSYSADDEDGNLKKYTRRGPFQHKFLRLLMPFWSSALPTLPMSAPSRKDTSNVDLPDGRARRHRSSRTDPRKLLLVLAIMACMATMGILYYRIAQGGLGEEQLQRFAAVTSAVATDGRGAHQ